MTEADFGALNRVESEEHTSAARDANARGAGHDKTSLHGWAVVAAAAFGLFFGGYPIAAACFGVFFGSFAQDFRAGRASIALAFTILNFISGVLSVAIGRLCDRFGSRKVVLTGLAVLG